MIRVMVRSKGDRKSLTLYYVDPVTQKEVTRSARTSDPKQAERNAIRWEEELKQRRGKADDSWDYVRERYEAEHVSQLARKSQAGTATGLNTFRKFWSGGSIREITPTVISKFQASLRDDYPATTITSYLRVLKAFLRWAAKMQVIDKAPAFFMPRKTPGKLSKGRPLTESEWLLFLKTCGDEQWQRFSTLIRLGGLRLEEAFICSWDGSRIRAEVDAKPHPRMFFRADSHKARRDMYVPMPPDLYAWLLQTPQELRRGLVCPLSGEGKNRYGEPYTDAAGAGKVLAKIGREAGIVTGRTHKGLPTFASAHDLRRTFGTYWANRVKPLTLQRLMRHADFSTTLAYYVDLSIEDIGKDVWSTVPKTVPMTAQERELMRWAECDFPEEL